MSTEIRAYQSPPVNSFHLFRAMVGIGIICALLIVLTYEGTLAGIAQNKAMALERAIFKVLPGAVTKRAFRLTEDDTFVPADKGESSGQLVYAGYAADGTFVGVAVEASGMGFADVLRILYGYDPAREAIIGFYVLESKETPGLGDKIEKDPAFLANFEALDVSLNASGSMPEHPVIPVKHGTKAHPWEVDGITGATISSRAIGYTLGTSTAHWVPLIFRNRHVFVGAENAIEQQHGQSGSE